MTILQQLSVFQNSCAQHTNSISEYLFSTTHNIFDYASEIAPSTMEMLIAHGLDHFTSEETHFALLLAGPSILTSLFGVVVGGLGCSFYMLSKGFEVGKMSADSTDSLLDYISTQYETLMAYNADQAEIIPNDTHDQAEIIPNDRYDQAEIIPNHTEENTLETLIKCSGNPVEIISSEYNV